MALVTETAVGCSSGSLEGSGVGSHTLSMSLGELEESYRSPLYKFFSPVIST